MFFLPLLLFHAAAAVFQNLSPGRGIVTLPPVGVVTFQFSTPALLTVSADSLTSSAPFVVRILSQSQKNLYESSHVAPSSVLAAASTARYRLFRVPIGSTKIVMPSQTFNGDQFVVISNDNSHEISIAYNVKVTPIMAPSNGYAALVPGACGAFTVGPWPFAVTLVKVDSVALHKVEIDSFCTQDSGGRTNACPISAYWLKQGDFNNITNPSQTGEFSYQSDLKLSKTALKQAPTVNVTDAPSYIAFFADEGSTSYAHVTYRIGTPGRADGCPCMQYGCGGLDCDELVCDTPCTVLGCRCDSKCDSPNVCKNGFCIPPPPASTSPPPGTTTATPATTTQKTTTAEPVSPPTRVPVSAEPTESSLEESGHDPSKSTTLAAAGSTSSATDLAPAGSQGGNVCLPASVDQCASMCGASDNVARCECDMGGQFASSSCINSSMTSPGLSNEIIIAIAVVASILILVAGVVVVCALRRRKDRAGGDSHLRGSTAQQQSQGINMHEASSAAQFHAIGTVPAHQPQQQQQQQQQFWQAQEQQPPPQSQDKQYARAEFDTPYTQSEFKPLGAPMELGTLAPELFSGGTMATGDINAMQQPIIYSEVPRQSAVDNDAQRSNLIQSNSNWDESVADL
jgi:hypothetical protein